MFATWFWTTMIHDSDQYLLLRSMLTIPHPYETFSYLYTKTTNDMYSWWPCKQQKKQYFPYVALLRTTVNTMVGDGGGLLRIVLMRKCGQDENKDNTCLLKGSIFFCHISAFLSLILRDTPMRIQSNAYVVPPNNFQLRTNTFETCRGKERNKIRRTNLWAISLIGWLRKKNKKVKSRNFTNKPTIIIVDTK